MCIRDSSTIGYDLTGEEVKPILEKNNKTYQEKYIISVYSARAWMCSAQTHGATLSSTVRRVSH